jgi:hypothetical protein
MAKAGFGERARFPREGAAKQCKRGAAVENI